LAAAEARLRDGLRPLTIYHSRLILTDPAYDMPARLARVSDANRSALLLRLARESSPVLRYNTSISDTILNENRKAGEQLHVEIHRVLALHNETLGRELAHDLISERIEVAKTGDPYTCAVVSLMSLVPIDAVEAYEEMVRDTPSPNPNDQIFYAERTLAGWERRALQSHDLLGLGAWTGAYGHTFDRKKVEPLFHPEFGTLVGDGQRAELFAQAVLWEVIVKRSQGWVLALKEKTSLGASAGLALEVFVMAPAGRDPYDRLGSRYVDDTLMQLTDAIKEREQNAPRDLAPAFKKRLEAQPLSGLRQSGDVTERSLWTLLRLMAEEKA